MRHFVSMRVRICRHSPSEKANNPLTVTLSDPASMSLAAPLACANTFFSMPSLTGITATGGGTGAATSSPATDDWTS